ncbi:MAG: hypothetical protein WBV69_16590, partial [Candidatus Sulfotelmatobacter sp.]
LQPHPQNQPNPIGEGTTLKPDISLATKNGHFNLLPTVKLMNQTNSRHGQQRRRISLIIGFEVLSLNGILPKVMANSPLNC